MADAQMEDATRTAAEDVAEPPAKRARLSPSPEPPCSTPAAPSEPPSSLAYTIPTSSEQAVAESLSIAPAAAGSDTEVGVDLPHDEVKTTAEPESQPEPTPASAPPVQPEGRAAREAQEPATEEALGSEAVVEPPQMNRIDEGATPPPATQNSDFDDLDWGWMDKSDELEQTLPLRGTKGKGKAKDSFSSRPPQSHQSTSVAQCASPSTFATSAKQPQIPQQVFFQTASHKKIAVSDNAIKDAMRRFEAWDAEDDSNVVELVAAASSSSDSAPPTARASPSKGIATAASRAGIPSLKVQAGAKPPPPSISVVTPKPARFNSPRPGPSAPPPQPPVQAHTPIPQRFKEPPITPAPTLRRPLLATAAPAQSASGNASRSSSSGNASNASVSPTKAVKLEAQLTPKSQTLGGLRRTARPRFSTPFKKGVRPDNALPGVEQTASPLRPASAGLVASASKVSPHQTSASVVPSSRPIVQPPPRPAYKPVFDLTSPPETRIGLAAAGYVPESVSAAQAEARGAPSEIFVILKHPDLARHYVFDDASMPNQSLGPAAALEMLRSAAGPSSAAYSEECLSLRWVQNHWGLVLWKLAAMVRHKPEDVYRLWTWREMCRQLRYRYEREINRAERSAIKRIQEHDASPASSLVLCVRAVLPGAPFWAQDAQGASTGKAPAETSPYTLELTDGWYRIRASVDPVLGRAIQRKRIKAGVKLAIRGAKLHSGAEGTFVLDALEKSGLSLTGNSTSLARWDARLGFSQTDFAASVRSLTADGGCIACMHVVLTKVHPRGYVDVHGGNTGSTSNARSEAEERDAEERWQNAYEDARASVQADLEARAERWEEVRELVDEWHERLSSFGTIGSADGEREEECEKLINKLLVENSPRQVLKAAADESPPLTSLISRLRSMVASRVEQERGDAAYRAQHRLQELCPPRRTRSFQVVRFRDAVEETGWTPSAKLKRCQRTVQLTVWDAAEVSETVDLVEGGRFVVSNLQPTLKQSWRGADVAADIYLCTRRNTVWRRVS
ncbi:hypothetical protein OC842_001133 [Tilletia horrida]|uniref:BRCA2 OB1 domain-containing protein n=1 Tax=Tilletia horrida TaxID=155126 RepID=A0AAN6JMH7_9BASI|nr:hypothetical protein OC842_001133 [Tilletia horrida]